MHLSIVAAMAISVVYQSGSGNWKAAQGITSGFLTYYTAFFWLLSPIFPVVFLLNGFYTHSRGYTGPYKTWIVLRGVLLAAILFFAANFLLFGRERVGRSVAVPFVILASVGLTAARLLKDVFVRRYEVKPRNGFALQNGHGKVLIVGGAGYIGSLLVERLLDKGYKVRVLDSLLYGDEPLQPVRGNPDFELMVGDCRNIQDVVKAVQGIESVVHLAAIVGDPACELDHQPALETNYAATRMLIEIAKGHGVRRFLFASSCSVYGATDLEMDENSAVRPISLYGETKVDSEEVLLTSRTDAFHPTVLRYATVFGLGYRPRFDLVVNLLTAKARQESVITIFNGEQWRPFIHVRDLVEATAMVLEAPIAFVSGEIFNVGDSRMNHTLSDVGETIRRVFPDTAIENVDNSDRRNYRVNFDKLRHRLGFRARHSLEQGIRELKKAFDDGLILDYTDPRYHNQRFLKIAGSPAHKTDFDGLVMAAFSAHPNGRATAATTHR
ncbi:MAG: NAD-dependent epimerase/dehydratase family protein [Bryobacteraceae bacterium]|nr:NAD-dependent epimerase/dehydratase family protein [Bryobacteraceae bacterium]